ncbi:hypothetical protein [Wolbachia endosymbiont (group A) of Agelastica alni]|uniref:host RNA manipulator TomO n=1 Tax=Wolbachia endosymbiont (group A) of Agelastica alni TaxID=3066130 RepID=UPI003342AE5D
MVNQTDSLDSSWVNLGTEENQETTKDRRHSEDLGNESQEKSEGLDGENQEIPATPCSTSPEDLSLENAILANFPDGCDRSLTVELKDEVSFDIISKSLTFAEITNILNQAIQEDNCEELDEVVQNIEDYEGRSITLDNVNLKSFCEQQLNLDLNRSDHQHIYSNVLSQYKFDQEEFKYDYSVKELVLLAIAANDKLTERYQDILFIKENLSLLPLLIGGQKYIEAFIEKFHGTDGVYGRLKGQAIQLVEPNKIDFFSVIALRKEQELLNAVFVEYVLRDFGQVLKTSKPDPLYGVLETASLIKNEEFITIVLGAFERYINEPTKKASTEELLKKSFATLLETAISQEHISVVEYLCKRYTNSADHAIYDVYEQAFADDKVITILRQQILKNIGARGRKEIYDLILKTALDAGNIAFIEHLCEKCAECSNDVINYLDHKLKNNEFDNTCESTLVALSNTGSQDIIASVLVHVQVCQSILSNKQQVFRQTIQNILRNAIKEANCEVVVLLCQHVDLKFAALQAIYKEEFEKALPVVAEQLEKISMELSPSMTRNECQKNRDTLTNLYLIRSLLESSELINTSSKANIQTQANTQVNKRSSDNAASPIVNVEDTSAMIGETATSSQAVDGKNNSQLSSQKSKSTDSQQPQENVDRRENIMNNREDSTEELISNSFEEGEMGKNSAKKRQESIKRSKEEKKKNEQEKEVPFRELYVGKNDGSKVITEVDSSKKKQAPVQPAGYVEQAGGLGSSNDDNPLDNGTNGEKNSTFKTDEQDTKPAPILEPVPSVANENSGQVNDVQSGDEQPDSPPLSPQSSASGDVEDTEASANAAVTIPKKVDSLVSDKDVTDGSDNEFVKVSPPPEDNTHSPQSIRVRDSFGYTPLKVAHERNITVKTRNAQNLQSAVLSSQQLASLNVIEIFNKHGREDFTPLKLTVQEFLNNGISEIQLPASNGCITFNLNVINEASPEELQNIVKVLTDLYKNGALNDRTRNAIGTGAQDDIDGHRLSEEDPIPTPTPAPTPNLTPNPIPTPTPEPTPQTTPALKPTLIPSVANNKSEQVNDTQTNGKLPNNPGNGSITATQNTQKSKWPTITTWTLAVAGVLAGVATPVAYFAFSVSLLTTGIIAGVGVCCLVAALIIYCCNRPSSSFKGSNVELIADKELAATVS